MASETYQKCCSPSGPTTARTSRTPKCKDDNFLLISFLVIAGSPPIYVRYAKLCTRNLNQDERAPKTRRVGDGESIHKKARRNGACPIRHRAPLATASCLPGRRVAAAIAAADIRSSVAARNPLLKYCKVRSPASKRQLSDTESKARFYTLSGTDSGSRAALHLTQIHTLNKYGAVSIGMIHMLRHLEMGKTPFCMSTAFITRCAKLEERTRFHDRVECGNSCQTFTSRNSS
jgi:hypothetical protein